MKKHPTDEGTSTRPKVGVFHYYKYINASNAPN